MMFVINAEVSDPRAKKLAFTAQKTMYGGKRIAKGDTVFIFASENEAGRGWWREASSRRARRSRGKVEFSGRLRA